MRYLIALLLICAPARSAVGLVPGQVAGNWLGSANACITVAFPGNNTAGNFIAVHTLYDPANTATLTDSQGNTYVRDQTDTSFTGIGDWHASNIHAGPNTVQLCNSGSPDYLQIGIAEFSGFAANASLDQKSIGTGSSNSWNSGNVTTVSNGELILGYGTYSSGSGDIASGAGFTFLANLDGDIWEYTVQTSAGTINAPFTTGAVVTYHAYVVTYFSPSTTKHNVVFQ